MKFKIGLALLLFSLAPVVFADELVVNGGFESYTGSNVPAAWSFSGGTVWSTPSLTSLIGSGTIDPFSGSRMGGLAPYGSADTWIWQDVDFTGYTSATLSFMWKYDALDLNELDNGIDNFEVWISDQGQQFGDRILRYNINLSPSDGHVIGDWMFATISGDVSDLDKVTFTFRLLNYSPGGEGDWNTAGFGQVTALYLDDISIIATPEPASILLLGTGLSVIGLAVWRRRK